MLQRLGELLVVGDVVGEVAVLIAPRDARVGQQARGRLDSRTQSQRVTREMPSTVIVFHVVSSQIAQATKGSYR